jgi:hypothetical protein
VLGRFIQGCDAVPFLFRRTDEVEMLDALLFVSAVLTGRGWRRVVSMEYLLVSLVDSSPSSRGIQCLLARGPGPGIDTYRRM